MSYKTAAVAYIAQKIRTTSRSQLIREINDAPLKKKDREFMFYVLDGLSYAQLAEIYGVCEGRIYQWKRSVFEKLHRYDITRLALSQVRTYNGR